MRPMTDVLRFHALCALVITAVLMALPSYGGAPVCSGDCDGDGVVQVNELVAAVRATLEPGELEACASADADGDGLVSVAELVAAVNGALNGCAGLLRTPTPTPAPVAGDEFEPDDDPRRASSIECGEGQRRTFDPPGDVDWISFELPERAAVRIETFGDLDELNLELQLFTSRRAFLAGDYYRIGVGCGPETLSAGSYLVRAQGLSWEPSDSLDPVDYELVLICFSCPPSEATSTPTPSPSPTFTRSPSVAVPPDAFEPDDIPNQASSIACGETQQHTFSRSNRFGWDVDWVRLSLSTRSSVRVDTSPGAEIRLHTQSGALMSWHSARWKPSVEGMHWKPETICSRSVAGTSRWPTSFR